MKLRQRLPTDMITAIIPDDQRLSDLVKAYRRIGLVDPILLRYNICSMFGITEQDLTDPQERYAPAQFARYALLSECKRAKIDWPLYDALCGFRWCSYQRKRTEEKSEFFAQSGKYYRLCEIARKAAINRVWLPSINEELYSRAVKYVEHDPSPSDEENQIESRSLLAASLLWLDLTCAAMWQLFGIPPRNKNQYLGRARRRSAQGRSIGSAALRHLDSLASVTTVPDGQTSAE